MKIPIIEIVEAVIVAMGKIVIIGKVGLPWVRAFI
jgi:hypothetical protein